MLYRKMRHPWCNFAVMKECLNNFFVRRMIAQRPSNFAVSPSGKPPRTGVANIRSRLTREDLVVALKQYKNQNMKTILKKVDKVDEVYL